MENVGILQCTIYIYIHLLDFQSLYSPFADVGKVEFAAFATSTKVDIIKIRKSSLAIFLEAAAQDTKGKTTTSQ